MSKDIRNMTTVELQAFMESPEWVSWWVEMEAQKAQELAAWKARPVKRFNALPFVGKAYRSRARRSANKVTAWAVNPPACTAEAAALGADYAFQFADTVAYSDYAKIRGTGYLLEAVIVGMADTLAKAGPDEREHHIACIRGFAGVLEYCASSWLSGSDDADDACQHQYRQAQLPQIQAGMRANNAASRTRQNKEFTQRLIVGAA